MSGAAAAAAARLVSGRAVRVDPLGGSVYRVHTDSGDQVVVKRHDQPSAVLAEVASLAWLAQAGPLPVPDVYGHDDGWLAQSYLPPGRPSAAAAERFGRGLADLHASGASAFGCAPPGGPEQAWIGRAPMRNATGASWPEWFAAHRIEPYLRVAVDQGAVDRADAAMIEAVCSRVGELAGPAEPPARLHGDLWSGNVHWAEGGHTYLIDPAAHGGHRESDLAMLRLFGCPHLDRVLAGYHERAPLAAGWRDRVALHQLFPLLVHAVLFGGGYGASAGSAARAALRA